MQTEGSCYFEDAKAARYRVTARRPTREQIEENTIDRRTKMAAYWVTFVGRESACVEGDEKFSVDEATVLATKITGAQVKGIAEIPYPASPQLNPRGIPPFCYTPDECSGRGACPKPYACSE
jgi:hypothetical protein